MSSTFSPICGEGGMLVNSLVISLTEMGSVRVLGTKRYYFCRQGMSQGATGRDNETPSLRFKVVSFGGQVKPEPCPQCSLSGLISNFPSSTPTFHIGVPSPSSLRKTAIFMDTQQRKNNTTGISFTGAKRVFS